MSSSVAVASCCGLTPSSPYSACYSTPRCNLFTPNWRADPWKTEYCHRFGHLTPEICPFAEDPCADIHEPLRSLDYFSAPPLFRHGGCISQFRCGKKYKCGPNECRNLIGAPDERWPCPGIPQLPSCYKPNPNPYADTICGLCIPTPNPARAGACPPPPSNPEEPLPCPTADDLPFTVYLADTRTREEIEALNAPPIRDQVERCLHPSKFRRLDTTYKSEYLDFFKMKTECELKLYRSPLAIDHHRPRLTLPKDSDKDRKILRAGEPLIVNARPIKWKSTGRGGGRGGAASPTIVSVCVPGPITIG